MHLGGRLCKGLVDECLESLHGANFRFVLDGSSVGHDNVDGRERFSVQVSLDKFTLFVSTQAVNVKVSFGSKLFKFLFHGHRELAPRGIDSHDRGLARFLDLKGGIGGVKLLDLGFTSDPQVTIPGLLGTVNVDTAFSLGGTVGVGQTDETSLTFGGIVEPWGLVSLEFEVDEFGGAIFGDRDGILGISNGWVSLGVKRMVGNFVLGDVVEGVLKGPVGDGVALGKSSTNGGIFELVDRGTFKSLPSRSAVDHAVGVEGLESALERFDLADAVVLLDVLLPEIDTVPLVVGSLVTDRNTFGAEDLGLEPVELLDFFQEIHGLGEEVESVDDHDLALAVRKVAHAVQKVSDDNISGNHGIGEDGVIVVLARDLEGKHGLLFQVLQSHFLGVGDVFLLVEHVFGHFQTRGVAEGGTGRKGRAKGSAEGGSEGKNKLHGGYDIESFTQKIMGFEFRRSAWIGRCRRAEEARMNE
jgi:hypothetical protein